jgi:hypothetical protein
MRLGGDQVAAGGEGIGDCSVDGEKALGGTGGAETLHLALALSDRHMRAFSPVVLALASDMLAGQTELTDRSRVGAKPVSDQRLWRHALLLQQLTYQAECRVLIPVTLHQNLEDLALDIDRASQIQASAADPHKHLV